MKQDFYNLIKERQMSKFSWRQFKFQIPPWCQENGREEGNEHAEAESYVEKLEASVI